MHFLPSPLPSSTFPLLPPSYCQACLINRPLCGRPAGRQLCSGALGERQPGREKALQRAEAKGRGEGVLAVPYWERPGLLLVQSRNAGPGQLSEWGQMPLPGAWTQPQDQEGPCVERAQARLSGEEGGRPHGLGTGETRTRPAWPEQSVWTLHGGTGCTGSKAVASRDPSCWLPSCSPEGQNSEFWTLGSDPVQSPPSLNPCPQLNSTGWAGWTVCSQGRGFGFLS